ncbi:MAG: hypothetical protein Fues2KO_05080 [Fuerstiella sp.]
MHMATRLLLKESPHAVRVSSVLTAEQSAAEQAAKQPPPPSAPGPQEQLAAQLTALQQLVNEVGIAIEDLQEQHRTTLSELQQVAVELAVVAASWLTGAALERDQFAVDDLVDSMIGELHREQPLQICLNPADAQLLELLRNSPDAAALTAENVEYVTDPKLPRGQVRAESARSILVADMDERLTDIRQNWLENLNDTQTERRADDPHGRAFRRFPERRNSA